MTTKQSPIFNAFSFGELSPRLEGRTDLKQYYKGVKTLENFFVYSHGGAAKRPGTKYIATAASGSSEVRVIPFEVSTSTAYIIELGDYYAQFYISGGQIVTSAGDPYRISTPYAGSDVMDLKFVQSADTMYLVHQDYPVNKMTRDGHTDWTIEEVTFYGGPFLTLNTTAITCKPTATTGTIEITASEGIFDADQVGTFWKFEDLLKKTKSIGAENQFTSTISVDAGQTLVFDIDGTWNATVTLQRSYDSGSVWLDYYESTSNTSISVTETRDDVLYRAGVKTGDYTSGTVEVEIALLDYYGYAEITAYTSAQEVSATVIKTLPSIDTTFNWAEGAWSDHRGYPSSIAFYEQRLVLAGSPHRPQTIWASQVDDFENFENIANNDDEAYTYSIQSNSVNTINWMTDHSRVLLFGTHSAEWRFGDVNDPTTPTSVDAKRQTTYGSNEIQAIAVSHFVFFIQRGGKKIRSMSYDFKYDSWLAPEVSILSEHLMSDGIIDMTFVSQPDTIIYMLTSTGNIVALTIDAHNEVSAFAKWTTDGNFESLAVIPGSDRDELWAVVKRNINGTDVRYVEQFQTNVIPTNGNYSNNYFMDSAIEGDFTNGTYTPSGADHLVGESVNILIDGAVHASKNVSAAGTVTLTTSGNHIILGLGYDAKLETMKLDVPTRTGSSQGKPTGVFNVTVRLQDTVGLNIGYDDDVVDVIPFRDSSMAMNQKVPLFNGDKEQIFNTGFKKRQAIWITSQQPLPCTILAIIPDVKASEF